MNLLSGSRFGRSYTLFRSLSSSTVRAVSLEILSTKLHSLRSSLLVSLLLGCLSLIPSLLFRRPKSTIDPFTWLRANNGGTITVLSKILSPIVSNILHASLLISLLLDGLEVVLAHQRHLLREVRSILGFLDHGS